VVLDLIQQILLGLGMFIFFSRIILESKNEDSASLIVALIMSFRGIVTFS
jgi:hypothetical protein